MNDELLTIQAQSIARNTELDITGLMIASRYHIAQMLEGPRHSIDLVMDSIVADKRHRDVLVVERTSIEERLCPAWRMACFHKESFGAVHVEPLLAALHALDGAQDLRKVQRLILALATGTAD